MRSEDAARVVNEDLALGLDGWTVEAWSGYMVSLPGIGQFKLSNDPGENDVTIYVTWKNVNTNVEFARAGYPETSNLSQWVTFNANKVSTSEEILAELRALILRVMEHELDEGMRLRSQGFRAPFHPHRGDRVDPAGTAAVNAAYVYHKRPQDLDRGDLAMYREVIDGVHA